jgi:hypothetical protein
VSFPVPHDQELDVKFYNTTLEPDHILEFSKFTKFSPNRTKLMYKLKDMFNQQNLRNGSDYLFLNSYNNGGKVQVWFKDKEYVSLFAVMYTKDE